MKKSKPNNYYTRILDKLGECELEADDELAIQGHLKAIKHYMNHPDKEYGEFACRIIIEDWFEDVRGDY